MHLTFFKKGKVCRIDYNPSSFELGRQNAKASCCGKMVPVRIEVEYFNWGVKPGPPPYDPKNLLLIVEDKSWKYHAKGCVFRDYFTCDICGLWCETEKEFRKHMSFLTRCGQEDWNNFHQEWNKQRQNHVK